MFFFTRDKKSAREKLFWAFFGFFHGQKRFFTYTFFRFFHAQFSFSRTLFLIFFTDRKFSFTGTKFDFYLMFQFFFKKCTFHSSKLWNVVSYPRKMESNNLYVQINEVFSRILVTFHGHFFFYFSRARYLVSRVEFLEKFHGHFAIFTDTFPQFFHGWVCFFHGKIKLPRGPFRNWMFLPRELG